MIRRAPCLWLMLLAAPAAAEPWDCVFTVECVAGESCVTSAREIEVIAADHEGQLFLSTDAGDSAVTRLTDRGELPATYASADRAGSADMLTIEADRTAMMSVHMFESAAQAATYFGTCGVLQ